MVYAPTTWVDVPDPNNPPAGAVPVDAANLNHLEQGVAAASVGSVPFSEAGSVAAGASGAWTAPQDGTVTTVRLSCVTAPSGSDLVVEYQLNGVTFATLTVTDGTTTPASATSTQAFSAGDLLSVNVTSVGSTSAAAGVVAQFDYSW